MRAARVTSATVPAPFTLHTSPVYTYDTHTSKPTCSVCGHVKFQGVYASLHASVNTPRHLNTYNDLVRCIMCNPEFCKVPSHLRLPGYPISPVPSSISLNVIKARNNTHHCSHRSTPLLIRLKPHNLSPVNCCPLTISLARTQNKKLPKKNPPCSE